MSAFGSPRNNSPTNLAGFQGGKKERGYQGHKTAHQKDLAIQQLKQEIEQLRSENETQRQRLSEVEEENKVYSRLISNQKELEAGVKGRCEEVEGTVEKQLRMLDEGMKKRRVAYEKDMEERKKELNSLCSNLSTEWRRQKEFEAYDIRGCDEFISTFENENLALIERMKGEILKEKSRRTEFRLRAEQEREKFTAEFDEKCRAVFNRIQEQSAAYENLLKEEEKKASTCRSEGAGKNS